MLNSVHIRSISSRTHLHISLEFLCKLLDNINYFITSKMPSPATWYCGHCHHGPMRCNIDEHCVNCYRQRDGYARYESEETSSTSSRALPPTQHPEASTIGGFPTDSLKLEDSTTMTSQGEMPTDSDHHHRRRPTGYQFDLRGLGRGQTFYCPNAASTTWFCCKCRHPCTFVFS